MTATIQSPIIIEEQKINGEMEELYIVFLADKIIFDRVIGFLKKVNIVPSINGLKIAIEAYKDDLNFICSIIKTLEAQYKDEKEKKEHAPIK